MNLGTDRVKAPRTKILLAANLLRVITQGNKLLRFSCFNYSGNGSRRKGRNAETKLETDEAGKTTTWWCFANCAENVAKECRYCSFYCDRGSWLPWELWLLSTGCTHSLELTYNSWLRSRWREAWAFTLDVELFEGIRQDKSKLHYMWWCWSRNTSYMGVGICPSCCIAGATCGMCWFCAMLLKQRMPTFNSPRLYPYLRLFGKTASEEILATIASFQLMGQTSVLRSMANVSTATSSKNQGFATK